MTQTEKSDMTSEDTSSSSSTKTEALKPWIDVARLGQKIIHELGIHKDVSVMERWMAQRVAELIYQTESTTDVVVRETAAKECEDLILRLWSKRNSWPSGGPLSSVMPTLNRLFSEPNFYYRNSFAKEPDIKGLVNKLIRLHEREMHLFLTSPNVAVPKEVADASEEKLDVFIDELTDDEIQVLRFVVDPEGFDESEEIETQHSSDEIQSIFDKTKDGFDRLAKDRQKLIEEATGIKQKQDWDDPV